MPTIMTGEITARLTVNIDAPGRLAIYASGEGCSDCINVKQVKLFAAVRVVAGVASHAPIPVQVAGMRVEVGKCILSGHVGFIIVALKAQFLLRHLRSSPVNRRIVGCSIQQMQQG